MFSFFIIFFGFEIFCFIFVVKNDKNKNMMYFPYFEISVSLS